CKFIFPVICPPGIFHHQPEMLKVYFNGVPGTNGSCDSIYTGHIGQFFLESAKQFVPDNEDLRKIFIKVLFVDSMMHTMVGGGNNYFFKNPHFANMLCMIPELRKQM